MTFYTDYRSVQESEGAICAEDVIGFEGLKLLRKGTSLTQYYINRLLNFNIKKIWVLREVKSRYTCDEEAGEDIIVSTNSIISGILRGEGVPSAFRDKLFDILYYSNPENFSAIVSYVNQIEENDNFTYDHCLSVAWIAVKIGSLCGMEKSGLMKLMQVGLLHDVGKSCIPVNVLNKRSKLDIYEYELVKRHPLLGYHMLKSMVTDDIAEAVLYHHEKLNGTGYPFGIEEEKIPFFSQIVSVADIFEALVAKRPYKSKISPFAALKVLRNMALDKEINYRVYEEFEINLMNSFVGSPHPENPGSIVIGYDKEKLEPICLSK